MIAHGALIFALLGRPVDAERWAAVAESLPATGLLPDGSTVEGTLAYLRANLCRQGPATMREDAAAALRGLGPASPYRATMLHTEGLSHLLEGDLERADASFAHAYDLAASLDVLAGDLPRARRAVPGRRRRVTTGRPPSRWSSGRSRWSPAVRSTSTGPVRSLFASAARAAAHRGDMSEAREHARRAARLRPLLTYALPVVSLQALVELARAYLALVDPSGARAVLEQARGILQQRPDLGTLATAARSAGRAGQPDHRRHAGRRLLADGGRAPAGPAAPDPPDLPRDRGAALHLPPHGQDPRRLGLSQARRVARARRRSSGSGRSGSL